jgi:hypothetical protein
VAGRKVYRTKTGRKKQQTARFFQVFIILLILAALVYLGYILAGPLFKFFNRADDIKPQGFVPPVTTEPTTIITKIQDNTDTQTGGTMIEPTVSKNTTAYALPADALVSRDTLAAFVTDAQNNGYTAVTVPLKLSGGAVTYKTNAEMAVSAGIVTGTMTAGEIANTISAAGLTPICTLNLLEDNTLFTDYRGVYKFASDDNRWYDNAVNKGGKPWISPFDKDAQEYLRTLSAEVSAAGFKNVIFDGLVFPPFRNSDLSYIGAIVSNPDRYKALINIWDIVSAAAAENGATPMLMMSADAVASGTAEICKPQLLGEIEAVVAYDAAVFPTTLVIGINETVLSDMDVYNRVTYIFSIIKGKTGSMHVSPYIAGLTSGDIAGAVDAIVDLGYDSYIVKN